MVTYKNYTTRILLKEIKMYVNSTMSEMYLESKLKTSDPL
jgi:hypothetical protein